MITQKLKTKSLPLVILTALALQGCAGASGASAMSEGLPDASNSGTSDPGSGPGGTAGNETEKLFTDVGPTAPAQDLENRERNVNVNFDVLKRAAQRGAKTMQLNVFSDVNVEITLEQVERLSPENIVIVGRVVGDEDSAVSLVMKDGALIGYIHRANSGERYEISLSKQGYHVIRGIAPTQNVAQAEGEECHVVEVPPDVRTKDESLLDHVAEASEWGFTLELPVVDVLVAYTPKAREQEGGKNAMEALIQMGIADTNRAMADSGVNLRVRLAGMLETKQNESGNYDRDLNALQAKNDGRFDEVHAERDRLGADQVTLVGAYASATTVGGLGFYNATVSTAFTAVKASLFTMYTFSHELGHNLGLAHSDGLESSQGRFRTILAYGTQPRIRRYSNPSLKFNGVALGDRSHNESAIINMNALKFATIAMPGKAVPSADNP